MISREIETKFLLQCLGLTKNEEININEITEKDWIQIGRRIFQHKIAPLVYQNFSQNKKLSQIPEVLAHDLRLEYFQCSLNNTRIYYELSEILKSAKENNIPIIALKGAVLAGLVYPSYALRPMEDMDLLIKPEDIRKANDMLVQLGWRCKVRDGLLEMINQQGYDIGYVKGDILLDLHTAIRELPSSDYWGNSQRKNIASLNMQILSYEDMLMHLCLHIYRHLQTIILLGGLSIIELIKLYDIVLLLRKFRDEINWDYIIRTGKDNNSEDGLYTILNVVDRDLGEHIPNDVLKELKIDGADLPINNILYSDCKISKLVIFLISNKLTKHFAMTMALHNAFPEKYTTFWFIKFVFGSLFPNKEYMVKRYNIKHPSLFGFYYPYRLITAIWMFLKAIPSYVQVYRRSMERHISEN